MKGAKRFIIVFLIVTGLVVLMAEGAYAYLVNTRFELFGHPCDVYMENISFEGSEITDLTSLKSGLTKFNNLKTVNLGSYRVYAEEREGLDSSFPGVSFSYDTWVNIEGIDYPVDTTEVDLVDHGYADLDAIIGKLGYLPNLSIVKFGENHINAADKYLLGDMFPGVLFDVVELQDICGVVVPVDVDAIDFTKVKVTSSQLDDLVNGLRLLPNLKSVDLHGTDFSWEERVKLCHEFPKVDFGWVVTYNDVEYDSYDTLEIDISKTKLTTDDLPVLKELTEQIKGLQKLIVCDCGLDNETLGEFRKEVPGVNVVWRLSMGKWRLRTDQITFSVLIYSYNYVRLRSADIQVLKYCTDLKCLDLGHQAITDISVIGEYLTDLRLLIMADNWISDLTPLSNLKHLHYLELFVNNITDLSPLAELHELVDVNISYNRNLKDITGLLYSPMMERVWLESTSISSESFDLLEATYPDAKVVRVVRGRPSVDQGWRDGCARYQQMMDMWFNNYYGDEFSRFDVKAYELGLRDDEPIEPYY
jgi:Leucine-rich repeat (LRR) protein